MKDVIAAIQSATKTAADHMTHGVRESAMRSGWPVSAAGSLSVSADGTSFMVNGSDEASDWEYGTSSRTPVPAVRRYAKRTASAEAAMLKEIESILKAKGIL